MARIQTEFAGPTCYCGEEAVMKTSWSDENPGRRFLGCKNYGKPGECNFFDWVDPQFPAQANRVIHGVLKKLNRLERLAKDEGDDEMEGVRKVKTVVSPNIWKLRFKWFLLGLMFALVVKGLI